MSEAEFPNQFLEGAKVGRFQLTYQTTSDVYKTKAAWTTVKIKPGTRPRTEYEYGNDMIARQMYSENSKAAVCRRKVCQSSSLEAAQQHLPTPVLKNFRWLGGGWSSGREDYRAFEGHVRVG